MDEERTPREKDWPPGEEYRNAIMIIAYLPPLPQTQGLAGSRHGGGSGNQEEDDRGFKSNETRSQQDDRSVQKQQPKASSMTFVKSNERTVSRDDRAFRAASAW